ncbi:MAG: hypothetical protein RR419_07145, partial [Akkermansia sp.]
MHDSTILPQSKVRSDRRAVTPVLNKNLGKKGSLKPVTFFGGTAGVWGGNVLHQVLPHIRILYGTVIFSTSKKIPLFFVIGLPIR